MPKVDIRLERFGSTIPAGDREFLHAMKARIAAEFVDLPFALGVGPLHGDAHIGNLMREKSGTFC
ncbi:hypothetical protein [Nocardia colli]|uniref:hypothetical protein n=1 Tax=Nocardia colli TaxID=2545717 RepID=UPI0035E19D05